MKNLFLAVLVLSISCKKANYDMEITPDVAFDGGKLIDKSKKDSIICDLQKKAPIPKTYNFYDVFDLKTFLEKNQNDLQIKEMLYFENKNEISACYCGFDKILKGKKNDVYTISFKNTSAKVSITSYSFDNEEDLLNAYTMFYNYSEFSRLLSRDKYAFRCCDSWENQIYFTAIRGNNLFFIDDSYNFSFDKTNNNIQKLIETDENIKMDDIYDILK
ncbi:MAG: hypothetical protein LBE36_03570 [Flavobacteriaceae bacterium]|jgi:hypothetical protein|nr:hypothetical protein [Flavobacteriaceae bacterium]